MSARIYALVGLAVTMGCHDPVSLPAPTGAHAVGRISAHFIDASRGEPSTESDADARELTAHFWYPAAPAAGEAVQAAPYVSDLDALRSVLDNQEQDALAIVRIHAIASAAAVDTPALLPVLFFSHGNDMIGSQYAFLIEELVSHGFVVVAIDHPYDARAVALADGTAVGFAENAWPPLPAPDASGRPPATSAYASYFRERVELRVADVRFLLDHLATDAPAALAGRLDLERVAIFGHSVGGVAAGHACQTDARIKACLNLDGDSGNGPFYLDDNGEGFAAPYMMLTKTFDVPDALLAEWGITRAELDANLAAERDKFFGSIAGGSRQVVIDGAIHQSFSDEPFVFASVQDESAVDGHRHHMDLVRSYSLAFFDTALRGGRASLLDDEPPAGVTMHVYPGGAPQDD